MCYDALRNGDATDRPLGDVLRAELSEALVNGLAAAAMIAAVLAYRGVDPGTLVSLSVAGVVLGTALHQAVLVAGVGVQRARHTLSGTADPVA